MEITADYQKLSDLNVAFYNQDINTSILQFNVTRNDAPVPLGKTNVDGYIVLLHEDGSRIQDNLVIENEEHGVIQYTIPRELLKHTGKVLGQVYIAVKGVDDTAVMRKISFDIKQDLMTAFSSTKKLEYIKTFDDLQTQIKQRVEAIEEAIANGEDYVAQMIETLDTGKKEIAATVSNANTEINKVATDANDSVKTTADTAKKDIASTATKATTDIDKTVSDGQKNITDTSNTAVATVNAKGDAVLKTIADNDIVQKKDALFYTDGKGFSRPVPAGVTDWYQISTAGNYSVTKTAVPTNAPPIGVYFNLIVNTRTATTRDLTAINIFTGAIYTNTMTGVDSWSGWVKVATEKEAQMRKITADTGAPLYDLNSSKDLFAEIIAWGNGFFTFYLSAGATNNPTGTNSWLRGTASTYGKNSNILAYDKDGIMYVVVCANGIWGSWDKTALSSELQVIKGSNTGWLPLPLLNGVTASAACYYRFYNTNGIYCLSFKGTLNSISTRDVIIAKLPADVLSKIDRPLTWIGNTSLSSNKAQVNRWSIEIDGSVKFNASSFGAAGESGAWNPLDVTLTI